MRKWQGNQNIRSLTMKFKIVYDNVALEGYKKDWGFSCLAEGEKNILFDTGANADILLDNMKKMGIDVGKIDAVVLSHNHWDHTGGLSALESVSDIYAPLSFFHKIKVESNAAIHEVTGPQKLFRGIFTTGEMGISIKEQSLIIETNKGIVVLTGCAHPGLYNIITKARNFGEIYAIVGGFHDFNDTQSIANIKLIAPCHCSRNKQKIKSVFGKRCIRCGAGKVIEI